MTLNEDRRTACRRKLATTQILKKNENWVSGVHCHFCHFCCRFDFAKRVAKYKKASRKKNQKRNIRNTVLNGKY